MPTMSRSSLSGEVETIGQRVTPLGIIYYSAGELHGIRNVGTIPATYLVFQFHSPAAVVHKRREAEAAQHADSRTRRQAAAGAASASAASWKRSGASAASGD